MFETAVIVFDGPLIRAALVVSNRNNKIMLEKLNVKKKVFFSIKYLSHVPPLHRIISPHFYTVAVAVYT